MTDTNPYAGMSLAEIAATDDEPASAEDVDNVDFGAPRVRLKWYTPQGDASIGVMARVSNPKAAIDDPAEKLIGYLIKNRHWSPFEMASACVEIDTERDLAAQILRHRSFSFQEFSQRYAEVEDLRHWTECRFQDPKNRQSSTKATEEDEATVAYFDAVVHETRIRTLEAYRELLSRGVAKECARRILPIGLTPTKIYMSGTIRSWLHYLSARLEPGVQAEHREIAVSALKTLSPCFPLVFRAAAEHGVLPMAV